MYLHTALLAVTVTTILKNHANLTYAEALIAAYMHAASLWLVLCVFFVWKFNGD